MNCEFIVYGHDFKILGITLTHTFAHVSPNNLEGFACYGNIYPLDESQKVSNAAKGIYEIPNCYRYPIKIGSHTLFSDTADLGMYARHAVCHQAANCFMVQTRTTLDPSKVRGSGASYFAYGMYGSNIPIIGDSKRFHENWLQQIYEPCTKKHPSLEKITSTDSTSEQDIFKSLHSLYDNLTQKNISKPQDIITQECATILNVIEPNFDYKKIEDKHIDYLKEHTSIVTSNKLKGIQLASKINDLSIQFQKSLTDIIDENMYQKIFAVKLGNVCGIVEPGIAELEEKLD